MTARFCLMSLALATVAACAHGDAAKSRTAPLPHLPELGWYRFPGGEFSILMPPGVKREEKTRAIANGEVKVHLAQAMPADAAEIYLVSYAEFPPDTLKEASTPAILDGVQQATVRELGGELIASKEIVTEGMPGREFEAREPGEGNILARVLVGKEGIFTLVGKYPSGPPPRIILRFLSSFSRSDRVASADVNAQSAR